MGRGMTTLYSEKCCLLHMGMLLYNHSQGSNGHNPGPLGPTVPPAKRPHISTNFSGNCSPIGAVTDLGEVPAPRTEPGPHFSPSAPATGSGEGGGRGRA